MSTAGKKDPISIISLAISVVGFLLALPKVVSEGLEAIWNPGVLEMSAGVLVLVGVATAAYVLLRPKTRATGGRKLAVLVLVMVAVVVALSASFWLGSRWKEQIIQLRLPIEPERTYGFEDAQDPTDVGPWRKLPLASPHSFVVSDEKEFAHSGRHSLRLTVDIGPFGADPDANHGGIHLSDVGVENARAVTAWVLLPASEQVKDARFVTHIMAYGFDQNGDYVGFFSDEATLVPGVWTPVFLGTYYEINHPEDVYLAWTGKIDELLITVYGDPGYKGSIYFDDITIFKDSSRAK